MHQAQHTSQMPMSVGEKASSAVGKLCSFQITRRQVQNLTADAGRHDISATSQTRWALGTIGDACRKQDA